MNAYLIAVEPSSAAALINAARELGGKLLHPSCGIAPWSDTADALCKKIRQIVPGRFAVCRLDDSDWSYR